MPTSIGTSWLVHLQQLSEMPRSGRLQMAGSSLILSASILDQARVVLWVAAAKLPGWRHRHWSSPHCQSHRWGHHSGTAKAVGASAACMAKEMREGRRRVIVREDMQVSDTSLMLTIKCTHACFRRKNTSSMAGRCRRVGVAAQIYFFEAHPLE